VLKSESGEGKDNVIILYKIPTRNLFYASSNVTFEYAVLLVEKVSVSFWVITC
jgi:hypothetical protein